MLQSEGEWVELRTYNQGAVKCIRHRMYSDIDGNMKAVSSLVDLAT
jgi:hypothetical protein